MDRVRNIAAELFAALEPQKVRATVERTAQMPYIVRARILKSGATDVFRAVVLSGAPPLAEDVVPADQVVVWASIYPASRFDEMNELQRREHANDYRAFLLWRKAHALGKTVEQLVPWHDFDAVAIDEAVERWTKPLGRYAGD